LKVRPVVPRTVASRDIDAAVAHYSVEASREVALGFIRALELAFDHIGRHPESGSQRYGNELSLPGLRSWPLKRYPYLIFYVERVDHVDVWRVLHAQRDIPAWMVGAGPG
jgi:toxin ParE1/3/4